MRYYILILLFGICSINTGEIFQGLDEIGFTCYKQNIDKMISSKPRHLLTNAQEKEINDMIDAIEKINNSNIDPDLQFEVSAFIAKVQYYMKQ